MSDLLGLAAAVFALGYWVVSEGVMRDKTATSMSEQTPEDRETVVLGLRVPVRSTVLVVSTIVFLHVFHPLAPLLLGPLGAVRLPLALRLGAVAAQAGAMYLRYRAMRELGRFFTASLVTRSQQKIVQGGPYAVVRHPGYAANFLLQTSTSLVCSQNVLALGVVLLLMFAMWDGRMANEERLLMRQFPAEYGAYKQRVPYRILPGVY